MITAKARAVDGPDKPFRAAEIKRRDLDSNDVLIEIKFAGICILTSIRLTVNGEK